MGESASLAPASSSGHPIGMSLAKPKSVLVPIDFSEASLTALDEALKLVDSPSAIHAIHVLADLDSEAAFLREALEATGRTGRAQAALEQCLSKPNRQGVQAVVREGAAGEVIAAVAQELGCDLIVMPSRGRTGLSRFLLGSVAERVLRLARCPVLVLRPAATDG